MISLRFFCISCVIWLTGAACSRAEEKVISADVTKQSTDTAPITAVRLTVEETAASSTGVPSTTAVLVAYVKDGDIQLWDETSGQSRTIFSAGDVMAVKMRDDTREIAFLRRSIIEQPDMENSWYEQSALWVVGRDGEHARELVSAQALRQLINASESDSSDIAQLEWIPRSHRLMFSGIKYFVQAEGASHAAANGVFVVDSDTASVTSLAGAESNLQFALSADGQHAALMSHIGLGFINTDGSNWRQDVSTYPQVGVPMPIFPNGVWTQDGTAFLLAAPGESESPFVLNYTIWRIAQDGAPAQALTDLISDSHSLSFAFSPDGRQAGYVQGNGGYFIAPLGAGVGPLAISYSVPEVFYANLHWSPGGKAYVLNGEYLLQLCPDARQASEVCGEPVSLGGTPQAITWIDDGRFLFMAREPNALFLGSLDGALLPIAAWSPGEWVNWRSFTTAANWENP